MRSISSFHRWKSEPNGDAAVPRCIAGGLERRIGVLLVCVDGWFAFRSDRPLD
jgi:hypothetical protein